MKAMGAILSTLLLARLTGRSVRPAIGDEGDRLQNASSSKLALLKAASEDENLVPSDDSSGKQGSIIK